MNDYRCIGNFSVRNFYAHILQMQWLMLTLQKLLSSHTIMNISEDKQQIKRKMGLSLSAALELSPAIIEMKYLSQN